jgi:hypothetical protein
MTTSSSSFFQESTVTDPTWVEALTIVRRQLPVPSHITNLIRCGWNGMIEPVEYIKVIGFSELNPNALLTAAEFDMDQKLDAAAVEHAISYLGIRFSAVVLAINYTTQSFLKHNPPAGWKKLLREMITSIEIGYKLGGHVSDLGVEGGALIGFTRHAGLGILMADKPKEFSKYNAMARKRAKYQNQEEMEIFGCSAFQVAALAIQQLGFGPEIALGTALGTGKLDPRHITVEVDALKWKAAYLWIDALREERNYPGELDMRNFFPAIRPAGSGERNMKLEILHADVGRIMREGSPWVWHLPKPGYEETQASFS